MQEAREWDKNNRAIIDLAQRIRENPARLLRQFGFNPDVHHAVVLGANGIINIGTSVAALESMYSALPDGMLVMCINLDAKPKSLASPSSNKRPLNSDVRGKVGAKKPKRMLSDIVPDDLDRDAEEDFDF